MGIINSLPSIAEWPETQKREDEMCSGSEASSANQQYQENKKIMVSKMEFNRMLT